MSVCNYNIDYIQGCYICNQNLNITKTECCSCLLCNVCILKLCKLTCPFCNQVMKLTDIQQTKILENNEILE